MRHSVGVILIAIIALGMYGDHVAIGVLLKKGRDFPSDANKNLLNMELFCQ
jgi:hypothetical protein